MKSHYWITTLLLLLLVIVVSAQEVCPPFVEEAIITTAELCENTGRNEACYGNFMVEADSYPEVTDFTFADLGNIASLLDIEAIRTQGLDVNTDIWGIALLKVQANLPDTLPGQNVTMLLIGEVSVDNVAVPVVELPVTATGAVNVRSLPRTDRDNIMAGLTRNQETVANGRLADNSWVRITVPQDRRGVGWASADYIDFGDGDIEQLTVVEPGELDFGPMQAFIFSSGVADAACSTAPEDGVLLQTPQGARSIILEVNSAEIVLGSTAFLQTTDTDMLIYLLEGYSVVRANGVSQALPAGTFTRIPLDENGLSAGSPEAPQPYDLSKLENLPLSLLAEPITIASPLRPEQVEVAVAQAEAIISGTVAQNGIYIGNATVVGNCGPNTGQRRQSFEFVDGAMIMDSIYSVPQTAPGVYDVSLAGAYISRYTVISPTQIEYYFENYAADGSPNCQLTYTYTPE